MDGSFVLLKYKYLPIYKATNSSYTVMTNQNIVQIQYSAADRKVSEEDFL